MQYRREIDGLRAVAVLPVMFFHAGFPAFEGGFVGVDVFFVISGYLITSIIAKELDDQRFSLLRFYERRARRILPALVLVVAASFLMAWHLLLPNDMKDFSQSVAATGAFSSNVLFWKESGYFGTAVEFKPLLHTWSLGVEEQFYLAFPLLLGLGWKLGRKWLVPLIAVGCISSLVLSHFVQGSDSSANFFLLPTRAWELGIGALTALLSWTRKEQTLPMLLTEFLAAAGVGLILYAVFVFDQTIPFPSLYALVPTLGTALVIGFASRETAIGRLLGLGPLVGIGLVSYSAYLWHQPLFAFARHGSLTEPNGSTFILLSAVSLLFAYLSWRFVESPARNRDSMSRRAVFSFAGVATATMLIVGVTGHLTKGYFFRADYGREMAKVERNLQINFGLDSACEGGFRDDPRCRTSDTPEVLLWGDSYAMQWAAALKSSHPDIRMAQATMSMCGPVLGAATHSTKYGPEFGRQCIASNDAVVRYLRETPSIKYVVLGSIFSQFVGKDNRIFLRNGRIVPAEPAGVELLDETLRTISSLGATPIIMAPMPRDGRDIGKCLGRAKLLGLSPAPCDVDRAEDHLLHSQILRLLTHASTFSRVIYPGEVLCDSSKCNSVVDGTFIYQDSGHLSKSGSEALGRRMNLYTMISGGVDR